MNNDYKERVREIKISVKNKKKFATIYIKRCSYIIAQLCDCDLIENIIKYIYFRYIF